MLGKKTKSLSFQVRKLLTTKRNNFERKQIETVCPRIHQYLFPNISVPSTSSINDFSGNLPPLVADNLIDHFQILAENQTKNYRNLLDNASLIDLNKAKNVLKIIDDSDLWKFETGWTKYPFDLKNIQKIEQPNDEYLFFDIEICMRDGNLPTLAIALGKDAWYGWCSERLINNSDIPETPVLDDLIPIGDINKEKIVIGHNIGFDRARCKEVYEKKGKKIRFMDTMSMSIPMFGMADHQQSLYEMYDIEEIDGKTDWMNVWKGRVSKNSLVAVHDHLFPDKDVTAESFSKKALRSSFVKDPIEEIRKEFQPLMSYCARDNILSAEIYFKLWNQFKTRFPHPATLAGLLNMGNVYLPINSYWKMFYEKNAEICEEKKTTSAKKIVEAAKCLSNDETLINNQDVWMWSQDWKKNQKLDCFEWFYKLFKTRTLAELNIEDIKSHHIALKSMLIPSIFGFVYGPYPLMKTRSKGWGFLVPDQKIKNIIDISKYEFIDMKTNIEIEPKWKNFPLKKFYETVQDNVYMFGDYPIQATKKGFDMDCEGFVKFYQLDHPSGEGNVGDPLTKHFAKDLKEKVLRPTRYENLFEQVLDSIQTTQFWTSYSERYKGEVAIWYPDQKWKNEKNEEIMDGAIAAAVVPAGTISRRSVHKLWVTLTNQSNENIIGTGIKSMVQAPKGYRLVGADVDSQEQWLAALYGDSSAEKRLDIDKRKAGKTAFSNMMLAGTKSDNTDLHSVVAQQLKISRNHAKTLNYARLYGSGENHAAKHLMRIGGMKQEEAVITAEKLFKLTKGEVTNFHKVDSSLNSLVDKYIEEEVKNIDNSKILTIDGDYYLPTYDSKFGGETINFEEWIINKYEMEIKKKLNTNLVETLIPCIYENFGKSRKLFVGGYESSTFNFLEMKATSNNLRTPILECQISDSLGKLPDGTPDSQYYDKKYKRSVMNWIVQSSAVDFLHLLLVSMEWLCNKYNIEARFVISIHDEVRYMCLEKDAARVALALQLSNLLVRAFISQKVGIYQLPNSIAFFSQVDCDTVLRKEVNTASVNPDGTTIKNGVAWTIDDILKITNGSFD